MQTLGKILGGLGLLALLSSPVTLLISGNSTYAGIKALVGVALIGAFVATNYHRLLNADAKRAPKPGSEEAEGHHPMPQSSRASFFYLSSLLIAVVGAGALGAANFIAAKRNKTWDLTQKKIYSLAPQTLSTLKELKEPMRAIGFLTAGHRDYEAVEDLFKRYAAESDKFSFEMKDPARSPDLAAKYQLREGQNTVVLVRGRGENESHTALSVVSEQELTNSLVKLNTVGEQKVYFVVGHGEWPLEAPPTLGPEDREPQSLAELGRSLSQEGYTAEELNLVEKRHEIPKDASLLVIAGAKAPITEPERNALRAFLDQGGRLLYFAEANADPGLDPVLSAYGVQVDQGLVVDDKLNPLNPYVIVSPFFGDHEMTRILKQLRLNVELPSARGLSVVREGTAEGVTASPLVLTSPFAWVESTPDERPSLSDGEKAGAIPLVVASTRNTSAAKDKRFDEARLVAFGDSELLVDANWGHEANRNLVMNAFAWASQQVTKITIRPPDRDISTIDIDEPMLARIRFISMDLLPLSLIGVGLAIWLLRRSK
ncbi:MAG: GldG family protein [Myxococcales bacterium]|nr:GldG family protein [Myxococcales bacterium]